jgi:hypothetical protein
LLIDPYDIAPVANRLTIVSTDSTSSIETRRTCRLQTEQPAQRRALLVLRVHSARVLLEDLVLAASRRVLQLEDGLRVEQVVLTIAAPLVLSARIEIGHTGGPAAVGAFVAQAHFLRDDVDADAADARGRVCEVLVDELLAQPDGLENLRAAITGQRGDAHLGHHLEDALVERLDVLRHRLVARRTDQHPLPDHVVDRLERQVGVDDTGAVPHEQ